MTTKIRKQIYLDAQQNEMLKQASKKLGVSEAEIIRQAIDAQTSQSTLRRKNLTAWKQERQFLQSLLEEGSIAGGRTWKREELHER
jgi:exonuclease III